MDRNPCTDEDGDVITDPVERDRLGIWTNDVRNDMIAEDANLYDDDTQVLIVVRTLQHAAHLKKRLPNFTMVYRAGSLTPQKHKRFVKQGLISRRQPFMTDDRLRKITRAFTRHKLKKAICTTIWNVGVDFRDLAVLIRGDAGSSPIADVQIPGRAVRLGKETDKEYGLVHDYMDNFHKGFRTKSGSRRNSYERLGFEQELPPGYKKRKRKAGEKVTSRNYKQFTDLEE